MSTPPPIPQPALDGAGGEAADRRLAMVERLAEIGMALAEGLLADVQGTGGAGPVSAAETALAYSRIARAVRLTVMLAERVEREAEADAAGGPFPAGGQLPAAWTRGAAFDPEAIARRARDKIRLAVRKDEVRQMAAGAIEAGARAGGPGLDAPEPGAPEPGAPEPGAAGLDAPEMDAERLLAEVDERLEAVEADDAAWMERPLVELAARICADLGVRFDPALWTQDLRANASGPAPGPAQPPSPPARSPPIPSPPIPWPPEPAAAGPPARARPP